MLSNRLIGGVTAIVVVGNAGAAPTTLQRLELVPGSSSSSQNIMGVSADGSTVVGWSGNRAAVWRSDGTGSFLSSFPGEIGSQANAVNSDGSIIVGITATSSGHRACMWTNGVGRLLPVIGVATQSQCWAVSEDGRAAAGEVTGTVYIAARWTDSVGGGFPSSVAPFSGESSHAWAMNSAGTVIAGECGGGAFRWVSGRGSQLLPGVAPSGERCAVFGMNPAGTVLVGRVGAVMARWVGESEPEIISSPSTAECWASACSADGNVLIGSGTGGRYSSTALIWTRPTGVLVMHELLRARGFEAGSSHFGMGVGVTADGCTFVGTSGNAGGGGGRGFILHLGDCPADMNADLIVDFFDYLDYVQAFSTGDAAADRDGDGVVDLFDYLDFVEAFGFGCE